MRSALRYMRAHALELLGGYCVFAASIEAAAGRAREAVGVFIAALILFLVGRLVSAVERNAAHGRR
jgi:hypothetical protein